MTQPSSQIASGLRALTREYDTISHNLANSSTSGFKRKINSFSAELQRRQGVGQENSLLSGEIMSQETIDFSQGALTRTGRSLDVALEGKGFIALETPEGTVYTRNGVLSVNILGQLVDTEGRLVAGRNGPISIPRAVSEDDIRIEANGTVRANEMELGRIQIVEFDGSLNELIPAGHGCFKAPEDMKPVVNPKTKMRQGSQEGSNVKSMQELTGMMSLSRLYESNVNVMRKSRENTASLLDVAKA